MSNRIPSRNDLVAEWLKKRRDEYSVLSGEYFAIDDLLDEYREHADAGVPLDKRIVGPHDQD